LNFFKSDFEHYVALRSEIVNLESRASALNQADQNRDHRQHKQDVDESTQCVGTDHTQQPENHE
jgi:hypothetical protein